MDLASSTCPPAVPQRLALLAAPASIDGWVAQLRGAPIPVLPETAQALEVLRADEDRVDARALAEVIACDPLMTLKLFVHASARRSRHASGDVETVTAALVMLGIAPFFRAFGPQPSVDELLHDNPEALDGLARVLDRAHRAAQFALGFAVHRQDHDAAVIHEAALLHDFAEMLLWCHAPELALAIRRRQLADPSLRSCMVQRAVLNVELPDLQHALMVTWRLPELLVRITDQQQAHHPSVRTVMLAIRLARHTADGWDNPALPDDVRDIGRLLNLAAEPTLQLLRDLDA
ncbi:MAG: HDOD domain-containing protein [Betaproteobacteria bacterium]